MSVHFSFGGPVEVEMAVRHLFGGLNVSSDTADALFRVTLDVAAPYQMVAYAGAYSWGTILEIKRSSARS
jgi:hypothetical protein